MYSVYAHPSVTKAKAAVEAVDKPKKGDSVSNQSVISLRRLADELIQVVTDDE